MVASIRNANKSRAESLLADMLPADLWAFPLRSFWPPHQSQSRDQALPPPSGVGATMSHYLLTLPADLCAPPPTFVPPGSFLSQSRDQAQPLPPGIAPSARSQLWLVGRLPSIKEMPGDLNQRASSFGRLSHISLASNASADV